MQTGLAHKIRQVGTTPQRSQNSILVGRIIDTNAEHNTVDVATIDGYIVRGATMLSDSGGTQAGQNGLPQVYNGKDAFVEPQAGLSGGLRKLYDEGDPTHAHDSYAIVGFANGYQNKPFVLGMTAPNSHQNSFKEPNMALKRDIHDILNVTWTDNHNDVRPPPFGQGPVDPKHPLEVLNGNWQLSFPDRYQDVPPDGGMDNGDDYQSYMVWGYRDLPRVFTNSNFDKDKHPFQLSLAQMGDLKKAQRDYARGFTLNQRWRSRFQIDNNGNITLRAEGRDFDSTHFNDKDVAEGDMTIWSRLGYQGWHRDKFEWVRMRPRHDGKVPDGLARDESLKKAKATGSASLMVQRDWNIGVRRQVTQTFVEGLDLKIGDYDVGWNTGLGGVDPGTLWDEAVLNPDFKSQVGTDKIWRGTKQDNYLRGANVNFLWARPFDSLKDGPMAFTWNLVNKQPPIDNEITSDCNWTLVQTTAHGHVNWSATLLPTQGHADASWTLAGSQDNANYTVSVTSDAAHDATIVLEVMGAHTTSIILDSQAGTVNITAPNGVFINGTAVTVP
jgi:hypothetical protein